MLEVIERSLPTRGQNGLSNVVHNHPGVAGDSPAQREALLAGRLGASAVKFKKNSPMRLMTLVLNADYQPLSTWPLSVIPAPEAITDYYKQRAQIVETWKDALGEDICFHSPSMVIPAPKVMVLNEYVSVSSTPKFSRKSILLRDRYRCQYCGKKFTSQELTFDHVIPREKGGKTEWTNILMACSPCNAKKANRMPEYSAPKGSGLRPFKEPKIPTNSELLRAGLEFLSEEIRGTWGDWLYWNVELDH